MSHTYKNRVFFFNSGRTFSNIKHFLQGDYELKDLDGCIFESVNALASKTNKNMFDLGQLKFDF